MYRGLEGLVTASCTEQRVLVEQEIGSREIRWRYVAFNVFSNPKIHLWYVNWATTGIRTSRDSRFARAARTTAAACLVVHVQQYQENARASGQTKHTIATSVTPPIHENEYTPHEYDYK